MQKAAQPPHFHVEAVGKPLWKFDECHANNSTSQNALYGPISSRGMVKGPPQPSPIDPSGGFPTASLADMPIRPPEYEDAVQSLAPLLHNLPPLLVAIDGRDNDGKTTLGRFLAWYFNVTLLESDLYLLGDISLRRRTEELKRIVDTRIDGRRPIIVEGVGVLQIVEDIGRKPDFHLYIRNTRTHWRGGQVTAMLADYEKKFAPWKKANLVIDLQHDG